MSGGHPGHRRAAGLRAVAAPVDRSDPLGGHRDLKLLERLHGRRGALRGAGGQRGPAGAVSTSVARGEELAFAGLHGQAELLAGREVSSEELVSLTLERIEASQPTLNAFRCLRAEAARDEARRADRRLATGEGAPLLGVPVAIKDDTDLAGETTEFGCPGSFEPKTQDREVARRLKQTVCVIGGT